MNLQEVMGRGNRARRKRKFFDDPDKKGAATFSELKSTTFQPLKPVHLCFIDFNILRKVMRKGETLMGNKWQLSFRTGKTRSSQGGGEEKRQRSTGIRFLHSYILLELFHGYLGLDTMHSPSFLFTQTMQQRIPR